MCSSNTRKLLQIAAGMLLGIAVPAAQGAPLQAATGQYVPGEVLVRFHQSLTAAKRAAIVSAMGNAVRTDYRNSWVRISLPTGRSVRQAVADYRTDPDVAVAQPNYRYHAMAVPDDPYFGELWAFQNTGQTVSYSPLQGIYGQIYPTHNPGTAGDDMDIVPAWSHITDCSRVIVAVVDTGVNYNQQDLSGNMWNSAGVTYNGVSLVHSGYNFIGNNNDPMDYNGHGTHVAGIIGAEGNNASGTTGVCWKASIMAVRVLDASGSGTTSSVVQGIDFAVANGAKVINLSLGANGPSDPLFSDAITNAENSGVVVVTAAGNNGVDNDSGNNATYPCDFSQPNLICVAALDQSYSLASFSDWGPTSVDVGAPGTNILSTYAGTNATAYDSNATPFTSGWTETETSASSSGWTPWTGSSPLIPPVNGAPVPALTDPSNWPSGVYASNTDDDAYQTVNLSGVNAAAFYAYLYANVTSDGSIALACSPTGGDPFAAASPDYLIAPTYTDTAPTAPSGASFIPVSADLSGCLTTGCTVGLRLATGPTQDYGAALFDLYIETLTLNTSTYNVLNGTSMATPEVSGLAAMLFAFNPLDTYSDVVNAIEQGGRPVASLAGMTTTGNAIDVMKSLAYLSPPTGLSATVH